MSELYMLDLDRLFREFRIEPRGVIHIGAHEGNEVNRYSAMGFRKVLLVEANPHVFSRLQKNVGSLPFVKAINCAISDRNGMVQLRVTSMDQSSSILPLKRHLDIYPQIREESQTSIISRTLDTLLNEKGLSAKDYNFLNIDIQGAELLAFTGAKETLRYMDAINSEVNFEELYEGCAMVHEIDKFLSNFGYTRVATVTPYHPSWGDAFYVKK